MSKFIAVTMSLLLLGITPGAVQAKKLYGYTSNASQKTATTSAQKTAAQKTALAARNAKLALAMQAYSQGKYKDSAQGLEFVDSHGGCCDKVHYFLGLDYQNMNQTVLAQMHYQWVTSSSKDARLRQYANVASEQLAYYQAHRTYGGQGLILASMSFG